VLEQPPWSVLLTAVRMESLPICIALVVSALAGEGLRRFALRRKLVDRPNERSLHKDPVPRVGGVGLVLGIATGVALASPTGSLRIALLLGGAVSVLGAVDDLRPLSAGARFGVQIALATAFVALCGPANVPLLGAHGFAPAAVTVVGMVGMLNIYNFMDGMDGLAGSQGLLAGIAQALLFVGAGLHSEAAIAACVAAACAGFLFHNLPPARMFMGDAGSTFLGFSFAALAALGSQRGVPASTMLLPLGPFLLDGTFTIFRRALQGEKVWRAHRSHLYQRAVQAGLSHRQVLMVYVGWLVLCFGATWLERRLMFVGWAVAMVGLVGVIVWVRRLETSASERSNRA